MSIYRKAATEGPNASGYYTAPVDAMLAPRMGREDWHLSAVEVHSKVKAVAEMRRDTVLKALVVNEGPHWHAFNPWADKVVYVPIERLAECVAGGTVFISAENRSVPFDVEYLLNQWRNGRPLLDAYILPQPEGRHSVGVRWGVEGGDYFSPYNANPELTQMLLDEFKIDTTEIPEAHEEWFAKAMLVQPAAKTPYDDDGNGYLWEAADMRALFRIRARLYDDKPLTGDARRDLANALDAIIRRSSEIDMTWTDHMGDE